MKKRVPLPERTLTIEALSHEGRGIAHEEGKVVFVDGALPGEVVRAAWVRRQRRFDEARVVEVLQASPDRVEAPCAWAGVCGGCSLQHMSNEAQLRYKQEALAEQLRHFGASEPRQWLPALRDTTLGYRRKARLGVRYVLKKERLLVGFREKHSNFLVDMQDCPVLDQRLASRLPQLREMLESLQIRQHMAQIEFAAGDEEVALIFRHLLPLPDTDRQRLIEFCREQGWVAYGQAEGPQSVCRLTESGPGPDDRLHYALPAADLRMAFHPGDFTQVHAGINRRMIALALDLLDIQPEHSVLDLFCGLGNFTLPLARRAHEVIGVEGSVEMTERAAENARAHGLRNVSFYAEDLQQELHTSAWAGRHFDRILIDPPRSGAEAVVRHMSSWGAERIVYVSCNPATLARDAGLLAEQGYVLHTAGVMDMFPHTAHVESIAVFVRGK